MKPIIFHKIKKRKGRGFSYKELKEVNLTIKQALQKKLMIDKKRKTSYKENINLLKETLQK